MCFRRQHSCCHSLLQWEVGRQAWKQAQLWCQCEEQTLKVTAHDCDLQQPRVSENTGHLQQLIWNTYCHPIRDSCKHTKINLVVFSYQLLLYWLQSGRSRVHAAIWMNDGQKSLIPTLLHNHSCAVVSQTGSLLCHLWLPGRVACLWDKTSWAGFAQHTAGMLPCLQIHC